MFRWIVLPAAFAAVVALLYVTTRPLGGDPQASFFVIGSARPGVQVGQIAPGTAQDPSAQRLALTDLDGKPLVLAGYGGSPLWIVFWKTACQPCEDEAADVAAAYAAHHANGLVVLGVDVWDTGAAVHDYAADHPVAFPIAVAPTSAVADAYGIWGAPTHYFIDANGTIRDRYFGPMTRDLIDKSLAKIL